MAAEEEEKYFDRKRAAVLYLKDNSVPQCFQQLLNDIVVKRPDDVFGYMAEYFAGQARPPTIANVTSLEVLSCRGYSSFQVEIQALIHGNIMTLSSSPAPYDSKISTEKKASPVKGKSPAPDSKLSLQDKQLAPDNEENQVQSNIKNINTSIKPLLLGCELYNQQEINKILEDVISKRSTSNLLSSTTSMTQESPAEHERMKKNDEAIPNDEMELEEECVDSTVHLDVLTVSMALVQSASDLQKSQLYRYLYKTAYSQEPSSLFLPTPMMSVLSSSKITAGKLYMIKNLMISMKKKLSAMQALKQLTDIYRQLELIVQQKPISNMRSDNGALTPTLDKPEQALDIVRDAISSAGYSIEEDVIIAISFATKDIYDKDKQKYEICMNTYKSCDELVSVYIDLCERYPEIRVLIDPFLAHDREGCLKLKEKLGENCVIINQESFPNNPNVVKKILNEGFVSGNIMKMENASTVVQFLEQVKAIEDCRRILFVLQNEVETYGHFIVDMAVAAQSDFIIFGGAGCSKNIEKYNRLVAIEHDMNILNVLIQREPHNTPF